MFDQKMKESPENNAAFFRMERNLSREAERLENLSSIEKLKIGIVGIGEGAGVSFVTLCLARFLANTRKARPAVVELGKSSIYDSIGMDKHFAGREFFQFYKALEEGRSVRGKKNMDEGINWIVRSPGEFSLDFSFERKLQLVDGATGTVVLFDLSGNCEELPSYFPFMDQVIAVIDPLPSKMLKGYRMLCSVKSYEASGGDVVYVINRDNKGVNHREMRDYLKVRELCSIPMVGQESIYTAEYNCKIPYSITAVKGQITEPIRKISERFRF